MARDRLPYLPGLDGLRAVAVLAVLLYHGQDVTGITSWLKPQGGFLGVEVFFVISGFLITALLLREHDRSDTIDLKQFWTRRARRLLPALYTFLAGTIVLAALFGSDALDKIRREILGAVFYVSNWLLIATDESYFEQAGRPSLLRHLWSLAIEEQFYLIWPLIVLAGLRFGGRRVLLAFTLAGVVASTALIWLLFDGIETYGDVTSVYYRTDARAAALLIGAALAFVWQPWASSTNPGLRSLAARRAIDLFGLCALVLVIAMQYLYTDRVIEWASYQRLYRGGFLALSGATVVVIAAVAQPGSRLGWALGNPVLRWIGTRSYSVYLWHWPIFSLTRPRVDVDLDGYALLGLRLLITGVIVELSYRLIEVPIRERRFVQPFVMAARTPRGIALGTVGALALIMATTAVAVAIPSIDRGPTNLASDDNDLSQPATTTNGIVPVAAPSTTDADSQLDGTDSPEPVLTTTPTPTPTTTPVPLPAPTAAPAASGASDYVPTDGSAPPSNATPGPIDVPATSEVPGAVFDPDVLLAQLPQPTPTQPPLPPPPPLSEPFDIATSQIHFVGDSVIEGAQSQLYRISPRVTVDGRIGRQWWEIEGELRQMRAAGLANDVVIIQLGNNGNFNNAMFDGVMRALVGTRLVIFINIRAPVVWEAEVNGLLARAVSRYPDQARLIDWYSAADGRPDYFIEDGTHLQGPGMVAFRQLIESTLNSLG